MTDEMVTLYTNPQSRGVMAQWMLEEVGAPYRTVILDLAKGEQKAPDFLAINPMGKVPAIVHRGTAVTETAAIIAYLADAFPQAGLAPPPGDPRRGAWYRWLFFGAGCVEPALVDRMFDRPPVAQKAALGWGSYDEVLAVLKGALQRGPWLLGEAFSAADLYIAAQLYWAGLFGAPGVKGDPVFDDYVARAADRPAFRRLPGA